MKLWYYVNDGNAIEMVGWKKQKEIRSSYTGSTLIYFVLLHHSLIFVKSLLNYYLNFAISENFSYFSIIKLKFHIHYKVNLFLFCNQVEINFSFEVLYGNVLLFWEWNVERKVMLVSWFNAVGSKGKPFFLSLSTHSRKTFIRISTSLFVLHR